MSPVLLLLVPSVDPGIGAGEEYMRLRRRSARAQTWLPLYMPVPVDIRRSVSPWSALLQTESPLVATYRCDISNPFATPRPASDPAESADVHYRTERSQCQPELSSA